MKVRIEVRPTGSYDGKPWPAVGQVVELEEHVALGMLQAGAVSAVKAASVETPKVDAGKVETATPEKRGPGRPPKPKAETTKDV